MVNVKIVFFTVPYMGHIMPNISLFKELLKRGFSLIIFGSEEQIIPHLQQENVIFKHYPEYIIEAFKIKVNSKLTAEEGADNYYSYYYDEKKLRQREYFLFEIIDRFYKDYYEKVKELNPDIIMYDFNAFFSKKIISKLNIQAVELNCNECEPKDFVKSKNWENFMKSIVFDEVKEAPSFDKVVIVNRKMQRFAKKMLYEYDIDNFQKISFSYLCPELQGEPELVDPDNVYLGFDLPESIKCKKNRSIYISRGTMSDAFGVHSLIQTIQGVQNINNRVIVSLGKNRGAQEIINNIKFKNNVEIKFFVNQIQVLSQADLFVTHGGITGVREALITQTPMIVIPTNFNDYQVGKALEMAGAGILIEKRPLDKNEVEEKVRYMIKYINKYREGVNKLATSLRSCWRSNGVERLISKIEQQL